MDSAELYRDSFVWDNHGGFSLQADEPLAPLLGPWQEAAVGYLSVNVAFDLWPWPRAILNIAALRRRLPLEVPGCRIVATVEDIDQARAEGEMAITFDIEGMNALDGRLELVGLYHALGVRQMLVAYNRNNLAGSGCHDEDTGLTPFGRDVIGEMNAVGMVVDCSHCGFRTSMEAMEHSADPVIFSHSNPAALVDHARNISDAQIRACAETDGVVGINGINLFLGERVPRAATVARHVAHVAELTGPEHVGLSLDYVPDPGRDTEGDDGNEALSRLFAASPEYWPACGGYDGTVSCLDVRRLPEVTEELVAIGFGAREIAGILGGNFRRVAERVWK